MRPLVALQGAQGMLFPFVPVFMAFGIGFWFALPFEPGLWFYAGVTGPLVALLGFWRFAPDLLRPLMVAVACCLTGVLCAGARAHLVEAPMLKRPYYGPVQGRIIEIDRSQSDALRLTLDQVVLANLPQSDTPAKVRVSLRGPTSGVAHEPGQVVMTTARLAAPEGPVEPGGFDFRRMAYFNQLGAVGYTGAPVVLWRPADNGAQVINRLRNRLSAGIQAAVPGDSGAFASGVMTGDRANISAAVVSDLRVSSLAHLLAISGMNMAFITTFVFGVVRYGVALVPPLALRINSKKLAAVIALAVAFFYLMLSGANVATTRAFLMVSVMLGAVLLDRRALSFRSVALSAVILLALQPEGLTEPGFQLSFAATVALIAGFAPVQGWLRARAPAWGVGPAMLVATSVLAGVATAPFAAAIFNRFTDYGLLANLMTVPVMSLLMGAGVVAALMAPFGLAYPALWVMDQCAGWILWVAHWIAGLDGAVTPIPSPGPWVMPLMTCGALWVVLWPGRARWVGIGPVIVALGLWAMVERPALLISSDGVLAGLMGDQGRALSSPKAAGFAAESWLADDGDLALPEQAALRPGFSGPKSARAFQISAFRGEVLSGKAARAQLGEACARADIVVLPASSGPAPPQGPGCFVIDRVLLDQTGALQLQPEGDALRLVPVRSAARIWLSDRPVGSSILIHKDAVRRADNQ
ncbi:MAG: ComEC/Rec2 family competence protein [Alphaproteobacteria bacterium]